MKLLLDVDGVLCPFGTEVRGIHPKDREVNPDRYPGFTYHDQHYVFTSPDNADRIKKLIDIGYDMHWCTGWMNAANTVIAPLHGLPEWPVVPIYEYSDYIHWKFFGIKAYVGNEPYAFVDDDIFPEGIDYANERTREGIPTLWLPTHCHEGLTDAHVRILEEFYRENGLGADKEEQRENAA